MNCRIDIRPEAWDDLMRIEDWYRLTFDAETAEKVTDTILHSIERLASFPESGSPVPIEWLNRRGYRMVITGRHVAIYQRIDDTVYIYHIADTRTQYTRLFQP